MALGDIIKKHRLYAGLSQAELGKRSGIPSCVISTYENGNRLPKEDARMKIARACGTDPMELTAELNEQDRTRLLMRAFTKTAKVESLDFKNGRVLFSMDMTSFPDFQFLNHIQSIKNDAMSPLEQEMAGQYIDFLLTTYPKYADKSAWQQAREDFDRYLKKTEKG